MVERVDEVAKWVSDSPHGRMINFETKMQNQWETLENTWEGKIVQLKNQDPKKVRHHGRVPGSKRCPD